MPRLRLFVLAALLGLLLSPVRAQERDFTLDELLDASIRLVPVAEASVSWLPDGKRYLLTRGGQTVQVAVATGVESPPAPGDRPAPPAPSGLRRRRATPSAPPPAVNGTHAGLSPDGKWVAFVRGNNLFVADVATASERQITQDGGPGLLNGRLDWVYEEEIYGRGNTLGYRWSPDSRRIAFLRLDESPVKPFSLLDHLPRLPIAQQTLYPKAGDANPVASLGLIDITRPDAKPAFIDLSRYPDDDRLLVRFGFTPGGDRLLLQVQNREQNFLDLLSIDAATAGETKLLIRERSDAWVDITDHPTWLADGTFLWESDRTGFRHLYRYRTDGTLVNAVTHGAWDVRSITRLDEEGGLVYFDANAERVTDRHLFRARLDGRGEIRRLTQGSGNHNVVFAPQGGGFFDYFDACDNPGEVRLCDPEGRVLRVVARSQRPEASRRYRLGSARFFSFAARDGYPLEGILLVPPDFDPKKRYPVYCPVYAGPSAPAAANGWNGINARAEYQFYAQRGILVWLCDNRSANPRGVQAQKCTYRRLGKRELEDIEDGLSFLTSQGFADPARIGIGGWSFGGFMTEYALTHSTRFKLGVAGAGVADWRLYDTIYTERYMSTPQKNPDGYRESAPVAAAESLSGKLLIVHGMMDDNVHVQNAVQFAYALQKAGKEFTMMLYPGPAARHGIGDREQNRHHRRLMIQFVLDNL